MLLTSLLFFVATLHASTFDTSILTPDLMTTFGVTVDELKDPLKLVKKLADVVAKVDQAVIDAHKDAIGRSLDKSEASLDKAIAGMDDAIKAAGKLSDDERKLAKLGVEIAEEGLKLNRVFYKRLGRTPPAKLATLESKVAEYKKKLAGKTKMLMIVGGVIGGLVLLGGGFFLWMRSKSN